MKAKTMTRPCGQGSPSSPSLMPLCFLLAIGGGTVSLMSLSAAVTTMLLYAG